MVLLQRSPIITHTFWRFYHTLGTIILELTTEYWLHHQIQQVRTVGVQEIEGGAWFLGL